MTFIHAVALDDDHLYNNAQFKSAMHTASDDNNGLRAARSPQNEQMKMMTLAK